MVCNIVNNSCNESYTINTEGYSKGQKNEKKFGGRDNKPYFDLPVYKRS